MKKEVGYIWQGFFLMLAVVAGMGIARWMFSGKTAPQPEVEDVPKTQTSVRSNAGNSWRGETLFRENCATCHRIDKDLTGPALNGVEDRIRDRKLLYAWVRNSPAILKTGNKYFNELYNKYNKISMSVFPNLTDSEIDDIISYTRMYRMPAYAKSSD